MGISMKVQQFARGFWEHEPALIQHPIYLYVLVLDSTVSLLGASPPELMFVVFLHLFYVIVIRILTCTNDPIKNV
jgi:protein-S-isoprenylcysteine O-methyltransferase Ste14